MNMTLKIKAILISALYAAGCTLLITLAVTLLLANLGAVTRNLVGSEQVTAALYQLKHAEIHIGALLQLAFFALAFISIIFFRFYKNQRAAAVLVTAALILVFFVVDLAMARVNGVPVHIALDAIMSILNSGVL